MILSLKQKVRRKPRDISVPGATAIVPPPTKEHVIGLGQDGGMNGRWFWAMYWSPSKVSWTR